MDRHSSESSSECGSNEEGYSSSNHSSQSPLQDAATADIGADGRAGIAEDAIPLWCYFALGGALLAVSSAGPVFSIMDEVPPIMKAAWRQYLTSILLLFGAMYEYKDQTDEWKARYWSLKTWGIITSSGFFLGWHFGSWIWSIDHTSLAHSLLLVSSHPILIVIFLLLTRRPLHWMEGWGSLTGFAGGVIMTLEAFVGEDGSGDVTVEGNAVAFLGAVTMALYFGCGVVLRNWVPTFLYACPVTFVGGVVAMIGSFIAEGTAPSSNTLNDDSVFGWLHPDWLPYTIYLAIGPGIFGHTAINATLKHVSPLIVSVLMLFEPIVGSLIGFILQTGEEPPGMWTWIGGPVLLGGAALVTVGTHKRKIATQAKGVEVCLDSDYTTDTSSRGSQP